MVSTPKAGHAARNASLVVAVIIVAGVALLLSDPSILQGPGSGGMQTTSETSTSQSTDGAAQVVVSAATCTGSGATERCNLTLLNSGGAGTTANGAGTLSYNDAGGMGTNTVNTMNGCVMVSGSLSPGQSEQVTCTFSVGQLAASGSQVSGAISLSSGDSVPFVATVS